MNKNSWESYKAKCLEKGLPIIYKNADEFAKAMTEPPKPYSTDDFTPKTSHEGQDIEDEWILDTLELKEKEDDMKGLLIEPIRCEECNEMKEETEFANRRGGGKSKVCKKCMGKRISDGHAKNHTITTHKTSVLEPIEVATKVPLLKERPTIKAINEETLHSMLMMAYKRGYDQGVNAVEVMSDDDAVAFVERSCGGLYE